MAKRRLKASDRARFASLPDRQRKLFTAALTCEIPGESIQFCDIVEIKKIYGVDAVNAFSLAYGLGYMDGKRYTEEEHEKKINEEPFDKRLIDDLLMRANKQQLQTIWFFVRGFIKE